MVGCASAFRYWLPVVSSRLSRYQVLSVMRCRSAPRPMIWVLAGLLRPPHRGHRLRLHLAHGPGGRPPLLGKDRTDQPDQADLHIDPEVYATWRHMISTRDDGKPRAGVDGIVICVRSFCYDLHTWANDEPERWAQWVAPCPVPPSEIRGLGKRRRRINEHTADRTRQRQPLLPILVQHVEERYDKARTLLEHARQAQPGRDVPARRALLPAGDHQERPPPAAPVRWSEPGPGARRSHWRADPHRDRRGSRVLGLGLR